MKKQFFIAFILLVLIYFQPKVIAIQSNIHSVKENTVHIEIEKGSEVKVEYISNRDLVIKLTKEAGYSDSEIQTWLRIVKLESDFNEQAKNPVSTASGLMQILDSTWYGYQCQGGKLEAYSSILCGIKIQRAAGWTQWITF